MTNRSNIAPHASHARARSPDRHSAGKRATYNPGTTLTFGENISVVNGGSPLTGRFVMADSLDTVIVARALTFEGALDMQNGAILVVNENLTMGSSGQTASIRAGSIQVAAGKTFTHY